MSSQVTGALVCSSKGSEACRGDSNGLLRERRGATFEDPKGRGNVTGYDWNTGISADPDRTEKENKKENDPSEGKVMFMVDKYDPGMNELQGRWEMRFDSDDDMGSRTPDDVYATGMWFAKIE